VTDVTVKLFPHKTIIAFVILISCLEFINFYHNSFINEEMLPVHRNFVRTK